MNYILVFDTETTGKPKSYKAPHTDVDNWPRITQLAWAAYKPTGELVAQHEALIIPDGWEVPKEQFFIDNNMSTERCRENGKPIREELEYFLTWCRNSTDLVAHNIHFDKNVIGAELHRLDLSLPSRNMLSQACTMRSSTKFCQRPQKSGRGLKFPNLPELYFSLFGEVFDGAHDAMVDVNACARCYFELVKRGIMDPDKIQL